MKNKIVLVITSLVLVLNSCNKKASTELAKEDSEQIKDTVSAVVSKANTTESVIKFDEENYDFKEVKKGDKVTHVFTFTNVGDKPLIISEVQASCGCTTPEYTKDPVAPGKKGSVTVTFDSTGFEGNIFKTVSVAGNFDTKVIQFQAKIK